MSESLSQSWGSELADSFNSSAWSGLVMVAGLGRAVWAVLGFTNSFRSVWVFLKGDAAPHKDRDYFFSGLMVRLCPPVFDWLP
jgi:hypothetical protein